MALLSRQGPCRRELRNRMRYFNWPFLRLKMAYVLAAVTTDARYEMSVWSVCDRRHEQRNPHDNGRNQIYVHMEYGVSLNSRRRKWTDTSGRLDRTRSCGWPNSGFIWFRRVHWSALCASRGLSHFASSCTVYTRCASATTNDWLSCPVLWTWNLSAYTFLVIRKLERHIKRL